MQLNDRQRTNSEDNCISKASNKKNAHTHTREIARGNEKKLLFHVK